MKIHITNLYNFNSGDQLVKKQHYFTNIARSLGFLEMGLFSYPVETDTANELSKRLDGIIAALEPNDFVFVQLPTKNGIQYEQRLINKIRAYRNTKIALILHDTQILYDTTEHELQEKYISLFRQADAIIAPTASEYNLFAKKGITTLLFYDHICSLKQISEGITSIQTIENDLYGKKLFLDCIDKVFTQHKNNLIASIPVKDDEIHIGFGLYDKTGNYSVWVGVTMQSIIEHTSSKICFHIMHDSTLNDQNRQRLIQVASAYGHRLLFHYLDASLFADLKNNIESYTIGTMFRIMLPELLPDLSKILYLDADLLVARDIKELWDFDISEYCLAAVSDADVASGKVKPFPVKQNLVPANRYFNAGVLYMNLDRIREKGNMKESILAYLKNTKESDLPDQDALNTIYNQDTLLVDNSWNYFAQIVRRNNERKLEEKIYHYVGTRCVLYYLTEMDQLYYETISRTPWGAEECRTQLNKTLFRITDRLSELEKLVTQIAVANKKKIFYTKDTFALRNLLELFPVYKQDYRILADDETEESGPLPCENFSALKKETLGTYIVFVAPETDKEMAIENLEQLGLKNGEDFFVIPRLLPPHKGGYM